MWNYLTPFQVIYETSKKHKEIPMDDLPWGRWCGEYYVSSEQFLNARDYEISDEKGVVYTGRPWVQLVEQTIRNSHPEIKKNIEMANKIWEYCKQGTHNPVVVDKWSFGSPMVKETFMLIHPYDPPNLYGVN